jgi:hypothetical protein
MQSNAGDEPLKTWVTVQPFEARFGIQVGKPSGALLDRALQQHESPVEVT